MIPVMQTNRGDADVPPDERGDCWSACFASILEVPIAAVPVPHSDDPSCSWWDVSQAAIAGHGYQVVRADERFTPGGYWVAAVPSLNLGPAVRHAVVMIGEMVAHDPCLGEGYAVGTDVADIDVTSAFVLVPLVIRSLRP